MKAKDLAKWFLSNNSSLINGYIDGNTKLNKLLYFSNLMYYSVLDKNLIEEDFERWDNGPVIKEIYKDYRYNGLCNKWNCNIKIKDKVVEQILRIINFVYGDMSAKRIADESHESSIWKNTGKNQKINFKDIDINERTFMKNLYETYSCFDFENCGIEKINGNKYLYDKRNITITDELVLELEKIGYNNEPMFLEMVDGELVFS